MMKRKRRRRRGRGNTSREGWTGTEGKSVSAFGRVKFMIIALIEKQLVD